ncbi:MAG: copper amine oxidase N-terminal domain-containing protein [Syntrophomonadaceae bacterium]|nr:copper amine oxidase N-terminal domain-containing protein [Syntrophomonadaceae bacterium]
MKKKWLVVIGVVMMVSIFATIAFAGNPIKLIVNGREIEPDVPPQIINGRTMVPVRWVAEALGADVQWDEENKIVWVNTPQLDKLQRQVALLEEAVAANTPREAVETWARGVKERNGALQYAILSPELKEQKRDAYESCGWVTGVSSPWIRDYHIVSESKTADDTWTYDVKYSWETSSGPSGDSLCTVIVKQYEQNGNKEWCVSQVLNQDSLVTQLQEQVREFLIRKYNNHYHIEKIVLSEVAQKLNLADSEFEAVFSTTVITTPLYTSPEDWPTQKGRIKYLKENRGRLSPEQIRKVEETIDFWNQELEMYIDERSETNEWLKVTAEFDGLGVINKNSVKIFSDDGLGNYYPVKEDDSSFLTAEELVSQGYEEMQRLVEQQSRR